MNKKLQLPRPNGEFISYIPKRNPSPDTLTKPPKHRSVYTAAHVVADPLINTDPSSSSAIDWEATLAYRRYLWSYGLPVAEAMDTAQRGMGLDWETTKELIQRSISEANVLHADIACGAGTDQLTVTSKTSLIDIQHAYQEQCAFIEEKGGRIILMASDALAAVAKKPEDFAQVYGNILSQVSQPVILHWLGDMFNPKLKGYWGSTYTNEAMELFLNIIEDNVPKIEGIKISLLDAELEVKMRRRLPAGIKMYTGDDFNFPDLILGDGQYYSDALLGIFDAIAPLASAALKSLDDGDTESFKKILAPTVPLSRHIFQTPTRFYKTGVVFLAYLNGHQSHFRMVGGLEGMRSIVHLSELFILADEAGLLADPEQATDRMNKILDVAGMM